MRTGETAPDADVGAPVAVVGITDAGPASLSAEALSLVQQATLLCGGERHLAFFPDHAAQRFTIRANLNELVERLRGWDQPAVVLASGDPNYYGVGPLLAEQLGRDRVRVVPNLGSVQLAFTRLAESWHDAAVLSAHGRPLGRIFPAALIARKVAILTDEVNTPAVIARALIEAGDDAATTADVFEHLDGPGERHMCTSLGELVAMQFAPLNLLVLRRTGVPPPIPLGLPAEAYLHARGLITKPEVRVVSLAKLRLHQRAIVWDVGAGSGSLAIEAAGLACDGRVYAVERDAEQLDYLRENCRRLAAGNVEPVAGEAPDAFTGLPQPDAVFIGGSGGQLNHLIHAAVGRLAPAGRIVANVATIEHLGQLISLAGELRWWYEVTQVSVARGVPIAGLTRLAAENPVFVVALARALEGQ